MKTKNHINFFAIGASFLFMFNPNVNIVDVLPDFIGYIILCLALTPLGDVNEYISDALKSFKRMIFIDAAKLIAFMWVFGISVTSEFNSSLMLWSFVFGALEIIILIPAYLNLFKGLTSLGYFHSNTAILGYKQKARKNHTEKMQSFTVFFVIFKSVMSFLPELSDLTSTEYYENSGMTNMYRYIGIMRFLAFAPALIIGIIWLVKIILYFSRIRKDTEFCRLLEQTYISRVLPKKGIFVKRNVSVAFTVLITAAVLTIDFRLERVNIFPDFISAVLLFVFVLLISKRTAVNKGLGIALSCLYFVASCAYSLLEFLFFKNHSYGAVWRDAEAMAAYRYMIIGCIAATVLFAVLCFVIIKSLASVIDMHTGYVSDGESSHTEMQKKMAEDTRRELKKQLVLCYVATVIYAVCDVCYALFAKDYGFMLVLNVACGAFFIGMLAKATVEIYEAVSTKYMLE